jgi:hypothetical protein
MSPLSTKLSPTRKSPLAAGNGYGIFDGRELAKLPVFWSKFASLRRQHLVCREKKPKQDLASRVLRGHGDEVV